MSRFSKARHYGERKEFLKFLRLAFHIKNQTGWLKLGVFWEAKGSEDTGYKQSSCYARNLKSLASWPQWTKRRRQGRIRINTSETNVEPHDLRSSRNFQSGWGRIVNAGNLLSLQAAANLWEKPHIHYEAYQCGTKIEISVQLCRVSTAQETYV